MQTKPSTPVVKGLIIALILIVIGFIGRLIHVEREGWFSVVSYLLLAIGIIVSCVTYSNQLNHNVTFGNIFADGFKTTAVVTCITIVFTVILMMIMPEIKQQIFDAAREQAEKSGASDEIIQKQQQMMQSMFWVFMIGGILVVYLIVGAISSVLGAAIAKKNPQANNPFMQVNQIGETQE
jgi:ABC-type Mn2+/Zn2+ transport system permease subunit